MHQKPAKILSICANVLASASLFVNASRLSAADFSSSDAPLPEAPPVSEGNYLDYITVEDIDIRDFRDFTEWTVLRLGIIAETPEVFCEVAEITEAVKQEWDNKKVQIAEQLQKSEAETDANAIFNILKSVNRKLQAFESFLIKKTDEAQLSEQEKASVGKKADKKAEKEAEPAKPKDSRKFDPWVPPGPQIGPLQYA